MPVHLVWGFTRDQPVPLSPAGGVSVYEPNTEVHEDRPETQADELRPQTFTEVED